MVTTCVWCGETTDHLTSCPESGKLRAEKTGVFPYMAPPRKVKKDESEISA